MTSPNFFQIVFEIGAIDCLTQLFGRNFVLRVADDRENHSLAPRNFSVALDVVQDGVLNQLSERLLRLGGELSRLFGYFRFHSNCGSHGFTSPRVWAGKLKLRTQCVW